MGFRIANIHEYERFIVIDLGTYRVRAGLYSIQDGQIVSEGWSSVRQNRRNIHNGVIMDMKWVAETIDKAIHATCRGIETIPEDIIIGFSPVIAISDLMTSQYVRHDPDEPLTMDEIDDMIEKIERTSLSRAKERAKYEYAVVHDDIRLVSSTLTSIIIDGKQVSNPIGFHGKQVRLTILNIYALASEYNILRSIVSSLQKNTISIVPMPLILPKIIEQWEYVYEGNFCIDIGYTHITLVSIDHDEILFFDSFATGSKMLMDGISGAHSKMSFTEIETLLQKTDPKEEWRILREKCAREYFEYVIDMIVSIATRQNLTLTHKNIFFSGGIFGSQWIEDLFVEMLEQAIGYFPKILHLAHTSTPPIAQDSAVIHGLALLGQELLHTKKDPIVRILRYTLYHYE